MIRLRDLESSDRDYFSAFHRLGRYLNEVAHDGAGFTEIEKMRLNTTITERIVEF